MSTTAEKLTYLGVTKEKIRDSINLTGANIGTSDTFRSYASKLKKGYIDIINNGIDTLYNNFPKVSGIGSNLSLTPTYEAPMKLNEIQGNTLQDGTPTPDTPVEIQSVTGLQNVVISNSDSSSSNTYEVNLGKNLLDSTQESYTLPANTTNYQKIWNTKPYLEAGTKYYISYNIDNASSSNTRSTPRLYLNQQYVQSSQTNQNLTTGRKVWEFTPTVSGNYEVQYWLQDSNVDVTVSKFMISKSSDTSYSTYFEPIELNKINTYQDSIKKSTGKNIITTYNYASSGYINYNYDNSKIGKTMTYSFIPNFSTTNATLYIRANTSISSYNVGTISTITSGTKVSVTFTLTDEQYNTIKNTTGGYIQVYKSGVSMDENSIINPMLEENSQATDYEPYGKVWYLEKQIGKVVLDGSETQWARWFSTPGVYSCSNLIQTINNATGINCISNYYSNTYSRAYVRDNLETIDKNIATNGGELIIANKSYTTLSDFKNWLSTHNTTVYTILATPEYTEITNTELIEDLETLYTAKSQEGTTNISITSEDLEMILNVSALKGDA